jgi:hypothetical protein
MPVGARATDLSDRKIAEGKNVFLLFCTGQHNRNGLYLNTKNNCRSHKVRIGLKQGMTLKKCSQKSNFFVTHLH